MKYEVSYLLLPTIMTSLLVGMFSACISYGVTGARTDIFVSGGLGGLVGLFLGVVWVTPALLQTIDPDIKMMAYDLRHGIYRQEKQELDENEPITIRSVIEGGGILQSDTFTGLSMKQWRECAVRIVAAFTSGNKKFTYAVVGQTERPKLLPQMLAAVYVVSVGKGEYESTDKGIGFWNNLVTLPYPWNRWPEIIQNLPTEDIYTQYIREME